MQYLVNDHPAVMTNLEISELVEKRRDNVKRAIENLIERPRLLLLKLRKGSRLRRRSSAPLKNYC